MIDVGAEGNRLIAVFLNPGRQPADFLRKAMVFRHCKARPQLAKLGLVFHVIARLGRLKLDTAEPFLQLLNDVGYPEEVLLGTLQLPLRLASSGLVPGDPRRFLKDQPTVQRAALQQAVDLALFDDRVGVHSDAGVHEQLADVFEPGRLLVEEVLAFT